MNISVPNRLGGWFLAGWLLTAAGVAWGNVASSESYALQKHAFTSGNPNAAESPSSENYRLVAGNLGDLSGPPLASERYGQSPGYLMSWRDLILRPDLILIAIREGRLWLEWNPVSGASAYTVEHSSNARDFTTIADNLDVPHWDAPVPVATSQFYRVRLWR